MFVLYKSTSIPLLKINISNNEQLTVSNYNQSSGTLTVDKNALLNCTSDFGQAGTTTNSGTISVDGDSKITAEFTGGTLQSKGDISVSNTFTPDNLIFKSKVAQTFNNSSTTTVKNLTINNSSNAGFTVGSVINVTETFNNQCKNLINGEKIVLTNSSNYISDGTTKGDLSISGDYVVQKGETLTVNGKLNLKSGANLTVEDGGMLIVKRNIDSTSATINVDSGGLIQVNDYLNSSSDTFNIDGDTIVKGDAKITSSTVNAAGLITFKGDLNVSSGTWNKPYISFNSKLPQTISGSSINVNNLTVDNGSNTGITFSSTINYYGSYINNASVITNESKLVKQS